MARGTTLEELLVQYRGECRLSLNDAHNKQARDQQVLHIQRTQNWLWDDFDWPLLQAKRQINLAAGQRFYNPPDDIPIDRINKIEVYYGSSFVPLAVGVDDVHYAISNPYQDDVRDWPVRRWKFAQDQDYEGMIDIWPRPSQDADLDTQEGILKVTGTRNLSPLVEDSDRADIDDRLIILFCASEVLASRGDKDAASKRQMANARYLKLRGSQMPRKKYLMFGVGQSDTRRDCRPTVSYRAP